MDARLRAMPRQHQPDDVTPGDLLTLLHQRLDRFEGNEEPLWRSKSQHSFACHLATEAHGGMGGGEKMGPFGCQIESAMAWTPRTRGGAKVTHNAVSTLGGLFPRCLGHRR